MNMANHPFTNIKQNPTGGATMSNMIRFDPFREMQNLRSAMDQILDVNYPWTRMGMSRNWEFPMDIIEDEDAYLIKASIPGINPNDLEVVFDNNVLTIKGEVQSDEEFENVRYHMRERTFGEFSRSVSVPTAIDDKSISATYDAGVLTLRLPKSEGAKPKRIEIKADKKVLVEG
jgi:HSP20 family protein